MTIEIESPVHTVSTRTAPTWRWLAITALVLGIATSSVAILGYALASNVHNPGALGVALLTLMAVIVVGFASLVVGVSAVVLSQAKTMDIVGLSITALTFIVLLVYIIPWGY